MMNNYKNQTKTDENTVPSDNHLLNLINEYDSGLSIQEQIRRDEAEREAKKTKEKRLEALKGKLPVIALGLVLNNHATALYSRLHSTVLNLTFEEYTKENFLKMAPQSLWAAYLFPKRTEEWLQYHEDELWDCVKNMLTISSLSSEEYNPQKLEHVIIIEKEIGIIK